MPLTQKVANIIINYVKPIMEAHPEMEIKDFKIPIFTQMVKLLHEGKIDTRRMRRWLDERVGERELEEKLGLTQEAINMFDQLEVDALNK